MEEKQAGCLRALSTRVQPCLVHAGMKGLDTYPCTTPTGHRPIFPRARSALCTTSPPADRSNRAQSARIYAAGGRRSPPALVAAIKDISHTNVKVQCSIWVEALMLMSETWRHIYYFDPIVVSMTTRSSILYNVVPDQCLRSTC